MKSKLPRYWIHRHGAYYYRPPSRYRQLFDKSWVRLGSSLAEAHRKFATLPVHEDSRSHFIRDLADRYEVEVVPLKAPMTQENNRRALREIRDVFGHIPVKKLTPKHCRDFFKAKNKSRTARSTIETLRHIYTVAVQDWGLLNAHPIKGQLVLEKNPPRDRYVNDDEFIAFRATLNEKLRAYVDLKLATGLGKEDLLCIERSDITDQGLRARRRKTKSKPKLYKFDEEGFLKEILERVKKAHKGHVGSTRLFHTRSGKPYYEVNDEGHAISRPDAFNSMWQRAMSKWVKSGGERFSEHDLRAKTASDADRLEHAQQLLDHADSNTTRRIYRRKDTLIDIHRAGFNTDD